MTTLSTGVELISKPSNLQVPPWQMVSAFSAVFPCEPRRGGLPGNPLHHGVVVRRLLEQIARDPGSVDIATTGTLVGQGIRPARRAGHELQSRQAGSSTSTKQHYAIFGGHEPARHDLRIELCQQPERAWWNLLRGQQPAALRQSDQPDQRRHAPTELIGHPQTAYRGEAARTIWNRRSCNLLCNNYLASYEALTAGQWDGTSQAELRRYRLISYGLTGHVPSPGRAHYDNACGKNTTAMAPPNCNLSMRCC